MIFIFNALLLFAARLLPLHASSIFANHNWTWTHLPETWDPQGSGRKEYASTPPYFTKQTLPLAHIYAQYTTTDPTKEFWTFNFTSETFLPSSPGDIVGDIDIMDTILTNSLFFNNYTYARGVEGQLLKFSPNATVSPLIFPNSRNMTTSRTCRLEYFFLFFLFFSRASPLFFVYSRK